ncbi:hypothetical protein TBS_30020 [Thermobispora bispora]|mgnify:CR=1 FL=1|jgi:hypothetical protein|uniref:Uncharacterized protein n=1 Tax=Thermobispora bispora (strain ATCC 19993 / DSM 43833 / CBS 139.67 / JCM 10125 / KCTC 9307 / NBRC 14880 / R51) TaxID=469371 RepID=D6Y7E9_THEBD|nr:hypothetical protein [Thermobispora bispora]MBO2475509.1 hypothetical protein [Actinomycetales bacterium]MDI9582227.1 hypothetical protein [Thermobispora sp.]ADG89660.1 hypothetical protein Tbis_2962 [Thermobispora bispora DSM 43833]MBX6166675.1 hypothetical protein [Thermobispora bispora]QSI49271.1 hypothetical protein CYL17_16580 [Thermobispora bispora]
MYGSWIAPPHVLHELSDDRIRALRREAEEQRIVSRLVAAQRARRQVERAARRLDRALSRL